MVSRTRLIAVCAAICGCFPLLTPARACSVPVFQYALERWPADPYRVTVFYRNTLSDRQQAFMEAMKQASFRSVNLVVRSVNVANSIPEDIRAVWQAHKNDPLPLAAAQYPAARDIDRLMWSGPFDNASIESLIDSPARRELSKRLVKGQAAVWVLLEGLNSKENETVEESLRSILTKVEREWNIPVPEPGDPAMTSDLPTVIAFSILRVSRNDPAERIFTAMLTNLDDEFQANKGPIAFPIFGRARLLVGLYGDNLNDESVAEVAGFIAGSCSCEVKAANPGIDMLVSADWDAVLEGRDVTTPELPLTGMAESLAAEPLATGSTAQIVPDVPEGSHLKRNMLILFGGGIAVLAIGSLALRHRRTNVS